MQMATKLEGRGCTWAAEKLKTKGLRQQESSLRGVRAEDLGGVEVLMLSGLLLKGF